MHNTLSGVSATAHHESGEIPASPHDGTAGGRACQRNDPSRISSLSPAPAGPDPHGGQPPPGDRCRNRRVRPLFFTRGEAGRFLGHDSKWLKKMAARHDLFKPSAGECRQGSKGQYHPQHLGIIVEHLMSPNIFTADDALRAWRRKRADAILALTSPRPTAKGRRAGK